MQDANKNRLYVHEVFVEDNIKKGDTLQTAAFQPHGGITLYKSILANVLEASGSSSDKGSESFSDMQGLSDEIAENGSGSVGNGDGAEVDNPGIRYRVVEKDEPVMKEFAEAQTSMEAKKAEAERLSAELNTPVRIITDAEGAASLPTVRQRRAKGFWSEKDGIVVVLSNHKDVADVAGTVLHEIIGNDGLRIKRGKKWTDKALRVIELQGYSPKTTMSGLNGFKMGKP